MEFTVLDFVDLWLSKMGLSEAVNQDQRETLESFGDFVVTHLTTDRAPVSVAEPVAWRMFDGEGGYNYREEAPTEQDIEWIGRYGRKYEPLYAAQPAADNAPQAPSAASDVLAERERQVSAEGWTPEHDDEHNDCEMVLAAIVYAESASGYQVTRSGTWPWHFAWFKPTTPRRDLVKAAALILAEIERLDRAAASAHATNK